jgi:hypothetical protein
MKQYYLINFGSTRIVFYLIDFNDRKLDLYQMISIFASVSYTRSFGSKTIRNDGRARIMYLIYRDRNGELLNYDLDIDEKGFVVSDKKKFKIVDEEQDVFQQLSKWALKEV